MHIQKALGVLSLRGPILEQGSHLYYNGCSKTNQVYLGVIILLVKVFRAHEEEKVEIDAKLIYQDSVEWTKNRGLNGGYIPLPYYVLKCQIAYPTAVELGLASGTHNSNTHINRANVFLYKKDNEKDPKYKDGYKHLCALAGPKPKY